MSAPQQNEPTTSNQGATRKKIPKRMKGVKGVSERLFENTIGRVNPPELPTPSPEAGGHPLPDIPAVDVDAGSGDQAVGFPSPMNESLARQYYPRPAPRVARAHVPTANTCYPSLPMPVIPQSALYSDQMYPTQNTANASPLHGAHYPEALYGSEVMSEPQYSEYIHQPMPYVDFTPYGQSPPEQACMNAQHSGNGHTNSSDFRAALSTSESGFGDNTAGYYPSTNASPYGASMYGASSEYSNDFVHDPFFSSVDYGIPPQAIEGGQGDMYRYDAQDGYIPNGDGNSGYGPGANGQLYTTFPR